jgi:glycosyltransferase involved in cell wall biosynthesis
MQWVEIVVPRYQSHHGVGMAARRLAEDLLAANVRVRVICARGDAHDGVVIRRLPGRWPYSVEVVLVTLFSLFAGPRDETIRHAFELPARGARVIHIHGDPWDRTKVPHGSRGVRRRARAVARSLIRRAARMATRADRILVTPSRGLVVRLERAAGTMAPNVILPNALSAEDPVLIAAAQIAAEVVVPRRDDIRVGFVAQGDLDYKGLPRVLELLSGLNHKLEVAGVSSVEVAPYAASSAVAVRAAGCLDRASYACWLGGVDGVIVASSYESFSLVALEALLLGVPVLALGDIGLAEFLEGSDALFIGEASVGSWLVATRVGHQPYPLLHDRIVSLRHAAFRALLAATDTSASVDGRRTAA